MANEQHIEWLLEGIEAWNARREKDDFVPDFTSTDLKSIHLNGGAVVRRGGIGTSGQLHYVNFQQAILTKANFSECILSNGKLNYANMSGAIIRGGLYDHTDFRGAVTTDVDACTKFYTGRPNEPTDLGNALNLTQHQLNSMKGDSGTIIPEDLERPEHWPDLDNRLDSEPLAPDATVDEQPAIDGEPTAIQPYTTTVQKRSVSQIRASLTSNYAEPQALASYMVEQIQREIADHEMRAKGNTAEALNEWNAKHTFLKEMLVTVQRLNNQIPASPNEHISEQDAEGIKANLVNLAAKVDLAIRTLDNDKGTYGNFWKIGVIGAATQLLVAFGVTTVVAAPIAAGVVGVSTLKVLVGRGKDE